MNEHIRKIARKYQEATAVGLPFSGTDEQMIYALEESFYAKRRELTMLWNRNRKLKNFMKDMIEEVLE